MLGNLFGKLPARMRCAFERCVQNSGRSSRMGCKLFDVSVIWHYGSILLICFKSRAEVLAGTVQLSFGSRYRATLILVGLLIVAASMVALANDPASSPPDVKGRFFAAILKLKPEMYDFGKVTATLHSAPLIVTATNKSRSASITFTSIVASSPLAIGSHPCTGALDAGKSCEVEVVFDLIGAGEVKNKRGLTFIDSAKKNPQHVELAGDGVVDPTPTPTATPTPSPSPSASPTPSPSTTFTATPSPSASCTPFESKHWTLQGWY